MSFNFFDFSCGKIQWAYFDDESAKTMLIYFQKVELSIFYISWGFNTRSVNNYFI